MNLTSLTIDELERHLYATQPDSLAYRLVAANQDGSVAVDGLYEELSELGNEYEHAKTEAEDYRQRIDNALDMLSDLLIAIDEHSIMEVGATIPEDLRALIKLLED